MAGSIPSEALHTTLVLVERARGGDRAALEAIARRYQDALARFAHGRVPPLARGLVDTCDVVQQAVVRTLARLETIDASAHGSLFAYLRRAVLNQIRDEIRRAQRRPAGEAVSQALCDPSPDPLEQAISHDAIERYDDALSRLPADQQEAFIMRIELDCGYREIATALGRPSAESARMLVRRAVESLARLLRSSTRES